MKCKSFRPNGCDVQHCFRQACQSKMKIGGKAIREKRDRKNHGIGSGRCNEMERDQSPTIMFYWTSKEKQYNILNDHAGTKLWKKWSRLLVSSETTSTAFSAMKTYGTSGLSWRQQLLKIVRLEITVIVKIRKDWKWYSFAKRKWSNEGQQHFVL